MKKTNALTLMAGLLVLLPLALLQTGCPAKSNPSNPSNGGGNPTNTPTITVTPTVTSTPTNILSAFVTIGAGTLFNPYGVQYTGSGTGVWVADGALGTFQQWVSGGSGWTASGTAITGYGSPTTLFNVPHQVSIDTSDYYYVADENNHQVAVFNVSGTFLTAFGKTELGSDGVAGVAVDNTNSKVYISDGADSRIISYTLGSGPTYTSPATLSNSGSAALDGAFGLFVDGGSQLYVADYFHSRVARFGSNGSFASAYTAPALSGPNGVYVDSSYNLYVTDSTNSIVVKFNSSGSFVGQFGAGILNHPAEITSDGSGNFYVADSGNARVVGFH
jgi:tripartite motif-containing protein 71